MTDTIEAPPAPVIPSVGLLVERCDEFRDGSRAVECSVLLHTEDGRHVVSPTARRVSFPLDGTCEPIRAGQFLLAEFKVISPESVELDDSDELGVPMAMQRA